MKQICESIYFLLRHWLELTAWLFSDCQNDSTMAPVVVVLLDRLPIPSWLLQLSVVPERYWGSVGAAPNKLTTRPSRKTKQLLCYVVLIQLSNIDSHVHRSTGESANYVHVWRRLIMYSSYKLGDTPVRFPCQPRLGLRHQSPSFLFASQY